ncbi:MAG: DPP IV N-terminal domain-containing protein, partial [Bacteroidales bacterium]|nr:DPP IV N-terminal domain-containing protein [Bacteroidales bacterium]
VQNKEEIASYSFSTGEKQAGILTNYNLILASDNLIKLKDIDIYQMDNNEKYLLLGIDYESIYRRSYKAFFYIYDLKEKKVFPLSDTTKGKQSFADFSPDCSKIAFVRDNNLFVKDLVSKQETAVTTDGKFNHVLNGIADWVYEEELDMSQAFTWSPDGKHLAYLRFDETRVKEFSMVMWGELYPESYRYKYPKAGEDNSLVDVFIYQVDNAQHTKVDMGDNSNSYIPRLYWLPNAAELVILKMNRHQNKLEFFAYNLLTTTKRLIYTDENSAWLDVTNEYHFLKDNNSMIVTSERNGYNHIYKVTFSGKPTPLTSGSWEVAQVCAVDESNEYIYYLSNESHALQRDLYRINFKGKNKKMLSNGKGWNSPTFNPTATYYSNMYSDANTPPVYTLHDNTGKELRVLQDNAALKERMKAYGFSQKELFTIPVNGGIELNAWMIKPKNFDTSKKYPVLMYVYGGPGSQEVNNSFFRGMDFAWYQMLAQKGYIVVCVDNRGTSGRGDSFKKCIYKQMGKYETEDQIAAAKYLQTLSYIDSNRVGIWGWSFGAYLSSLCIMKGNDVFKMAMAVAPVNNWRYYDNIYTERFLQTPQENPQGYDDNSPITHAAKLKGKYLLIHGTADDNVHFQNAMDLVSALNAAGIQYEQFFYPNKNHFIMGGNTRLHLYKILTDFVLENL